jgi:hypothetical protein
MQQQIFCGQVLQKLWSHISYIVCLNTLFQAEASGCTIHD